MGHDLKNVGRNRSWWHCDQCRCAIILRICNGR